MLNPRRLILKLLLATEGDRLSTREAVSAGQLLGFSENSVRVSLARLAREAHVIAVGRGHYRLGPSARDLAEEVRSWRQGEARVEAWSGSWLAVHTGGLGRCDRPALRRRERALQLVGLQTLSPGLHLRPDNLSGGVALVRQRLHRLGLPDDALVCRLDALDPAAQARAEGLWEGATLSRRYRELRATLEAWMADVHQWGADRAAREAFVLGDEAIRALVFDPLLPAPMVDVEARAAFTDTVLRFDRLGHECWLRWAAAEPSPALVHRMPALRASP